MSAQNIEALVQRLRSAEDRRNSINTRIAVLNSQKTAAIQRFDEMRTRLTALGSSPETVEADFQRELESFTQRVTDFEAEVSRYEAEVAALESSLTSQR